MINSLTQINDKKINKKYKLNYKKISIVIKIIMLCSIDDIKLLLKCSTINLRNNIEKLKQNIELCILFNPFGILSAQQEIKILK